MARGLLLVALAAALCAAPAARADGDPASDYLLGQRIFLPYDTKIPKADQEQLGETVDAAFRAGVRVRVAVIGSQYDLGAVTVLWKQPKRYAEFLAKELSFVHKDRLVVVMPDGLGFYWVGHRAAPGQAIVASVAVPPGPGGLARAGAAAVRRLAAAQGVHLQAVAAPASSSSTTTDRVVIAAAVAALLLAGGAARLLLRRRRSASRRS
ncbi:MAG TPA: hypothetical protein VFA82_02285 [Gaiellaceae bacterium]|nr:hypothetical protein [Gaiellaceae bacterium]